MENLIIYYSKNVLKFLRLEVLCFSDPVTFGKTSCTNAVQLATITFEQVSVQCAFLLKKQLSTSLNPPPTTSCFCLSLLEKVGRRGSIVSTANIELLAVKERGGRASTFTHFFFVHLDFTVFVRFTLRIFGFRVLTFLHVIGEANRARETFC